MNPKQLTIDKVQEILLDREICLRPRPGDGGLSFACPWESRLLLEGEAGVGKTEIAKVLAKVLDAKLIRLQCYEGLDANTALYEWNYPKQMLRIKLEEVEHGDKEKRGDRDFHPRVFDQAAVVGSDPNRRRESAGAADR